MLDIYEVTLQICREVGPIIRRIEKCDRELARQLRRCVSSVPLNVAEGYYSQGGNRRARYFTALGSARETLACIEIAVAMAYVDDVGPKLFDDLDKTVRTLAKLTGFRG